MVYKGKSGKLIEKYILKTRYNFSGNPKNSKYDLSADLNKFNHKNVSIKSSKTNTIFCADIFNFLNSSSLDLIIVSYRVLNKNIEVLEYYLFSDLNLFFINLNNNLNLLKLTELNCYLKSLKYPFSKLQRQRCHKLSKLVLKKDFAGFRINVKLSKSNKRIQCSLKLNLLLKVVSFKCLKLEKVLKL